MMLVNLATITCTCQRNSIFPRYIHSLSFHNPVCSHVPGVCLAAQSAGDPAKNILKKRDVSLYLLVKTPTSVRANFLISCLLPIHCLRHGLRYSYFDWPHDLRQFLWPTSNNCKDAIVVSLDEHKHMHTMPKVILEVISIYVQLRATIHGFPRLSSSWAGQIVSSETIICKYSNRALLLVGASIISVILYRGEDFYLCSPVYTRTHINGMGWSWRQFNTLQHPTRTFGCSLRGMGNEAPPTLD